MAVRCGGRSGTERGDVTLIAMRGVEAFERSIDCH